MVAPYKGVMNIIMELIRLHYIKGQVLSSPVDKDYLAVTLLNCTRDVWKLVNMFHGSLVWTSQRDVRNNT